VSQAAAKLKLGVDDERVRVVAHFEERGSILAGTKTGRCLGFEIRLSVSSSETQDAIRALLRQAHATCYTEDVLTRAVSLTSTHFLNGAELSIS
jgi:hypothetical protein